MKRDWGRSWQRDSVEDGGNLGARVWVEVWGAWPWLAEPLLTSLSHHCQAILHQEGHMDDALSLTRCQQEESQAARMIYSTGGLYNHFIK